MIAIFLYVGVEVATAGNLGEYLKVHYGMESNKITPYVSLYWASLMIGRWTSASSIFSAKKSVQTILKFVLPYGAFGIYILINSITKQDLSDIYYYAFVVIVLIVAESMSKGNPAKQLMLFSALGVVALLIGMYTEGLTSIYAFISVGLFCSTLWPCIFTLAIAGLGNLTNKGSGYLIMMIMGGGIVSISQGLLVDIPSVGIRYSFYTGIVCFLYLIFYAIKSSQILKNQGVTIGEDTAGH